MAKTLEEMIRDVVRESSKQIAAKLLTMSELSISQIAEVTELSEEEVHQVSERQKTVLGMANAKKRN